MALVWSIRTAQSPRSHVFSNTYHVVAASLSEAIERVESIEAEYARDLLEDGVDGPSAVVVAGQFLFELDHVDA